MGQVATPRVSIAFAVGLALIGAAGCDVKEEGKAGERGAASAVPRMTAEEFYKDYSSLKGADRLNKYGDGVAITGKVSKSVYLGQDEGLQLWLEVNGPGHIAARFHDGGAEGRRRGRAPVSVQRQAGRRPLPHRLRPRVRPRARAARRRYTATGMTRRRMSLMDSRR